MTFNDIVSRIQKKTNQFSSDATTRIGETINDKYKEITSSIGLDTSRRTEAQVNATPGSPFLTFAGIEKVITVIDKSSGRNRFLDPCTVDELDQRAVLSGDKPTHYAIYRSNSGSVQIKINANPQTAFTLYAAGYVLADVLSGVLTPAFPESFHDALYKGALYEEYLKLEKPGLAKIVQADFDNRMGDLRIFIAKNPLQDIYQGKLAGTTITASGSTGSGGGSPNGTTSYTQTGLITFDRSGAAPGSRQPFAIAAGSDPITTPAFLAEGALALTDITSNNVTSTAHGFAPKSPANAATFLNGAATPVYAQVKDADLSTSDVLTNNVTSTKHGFAPKSPADATQFLNGAITPAYAQVKDSDLSTSDITTNNVSTLKHGLMPKLGNNANRYFDGTGAQSQVSLTAAVLGVLPTANGGTSVDIASAALPLGGGQIAFPAVQNPSAGVNVLDDYEEGTWTPTISGTGGSSGQTYATQVGRYIKIGKLVWVTFAVALTAKGTITGSAAIAGFPFSIENIASLTPPGSCYWAGTTSAFTTMIVLGLVGSSAGVLYGAQAAATSLVALVSADLANNSIISGSLVYQASA